MPTYVVDYDLNNPGQNYSRLANAITNRYQTHWRMLMSTWVIHTYDSAAQIHNHLYPVIDPNDKLFVAQLSGEAAWDGLSDAGTRWLKDVLNRP